MIEATSNLAGDTGPCDTCPHPISSHFDKSGKCAVMNCRCVRAPLSNEAFANPIASSAFTLTASPVPWTQIVWPENGDTVTTGSVDEGRKSKHWLPSIDDVLKRTLGSHTFLLDALEATSMETATRVDDLARSVEAGAARISALTQNVGDIDRVVSGVAGRSVERFETLEKNVDGVRALMYQTIRKVETLDINSDRAIAQLREDMTNELKTVKRTRKGKKAAKKGTKT